MMIRWFDNEDDDVDAPSGKNRDRNSLQPVKVIGSGPLSLPERRLVQADGAADGHPPPAQGVPAINTSTAGSRERSKRSKSPWPRSWTQGMAMVGILLGNGYNIFPKKILMKTKMPTHRLEMGGFQGGS